MAITRRLLHFFGYKSLTLMGKRFHEDAIITTWSTSCWERQEKTSINSDDTSWLSSKTTFLFDLILLLLSLFYYFIFLASFKKSLSSEVCQTTWNVDFISSIIYWTFWKTYWIWRVSKLAWYLKSILLDEFIMNVTYCRNISLGSWVSGRKWFKKITT